MGARSASFRCGVGRDTPSLRSVKSGSHRTSLMDDLAYLDCSTTRVYQSPKRVILERPCGELSLHVSVGYRTRLVEELLVLQRRSKRGAITYMFTKVNQKTHSGSNLAIQKGKGGTQFPDW